MTPQRKQYDDDDGRVVCNMDVDGIRAQDKRVRREQRQMTNSSQGSQLTRAEARQFTWYAVLAGLLIASVFSVTWVLFILFCTQVWFR
jgi:hypothetical protein